MTAPLVSIVYITHRVEPRFDWFADSLARQLAADEVEAEVEVIVVDGHHSPERSLRLAQIVDGRFPLRHVPPKPTPYNGPQRLTANAYSATASARNTGIVYASAPYVVFSDDSCVLLDSWWVEVRAAARHGYVLAGAYENRVGLEARDGRVLAGGAAPGAGGTGAGGADAGDGGEHLLDSRWAAGDDHALVQIAGSQLFGCATGARRERLLELNGFDELCDPIGGEDTNLGVRLEWSGERLFFSRRMMVVKDANRHAGDAIARLDRGLAHGGPLDEARYMACLAEFGVSRRTLPDGAWDCGHLCLDILYGTRSIRSLGNCYDLAGLTEADLAHLPRAFPERYWATGEPLAGL